MKFRKLINFLIGILIILILIEHFLEAKEKNKILSYGDEAPDFYAEDINGNLFALSQERGKNILILFFNPLYMADKFKLIYAEVLFKRYKERGFKVVGISNSNRIITREFSKKCKLTFPIIADEEKKIHKLFKIEDCCGGFVFLNKEGKIEFYSKNLISEEEMRQLVEKNVLGKINYYFQKPPEQTVFVEGKELPNLVLYIILKHFL